jgi:F-type H+/Na+-transporting ATPase subunit alpha
MGELIKIKDTSIQALVLGLEKDRASALVLQPNTIVKEGMFVESSGIDLSVDVSEEMIGRIVDPFGQPLDDGKGFKKTKTMEIEKIAPGVMTRQSVDTPVQTGILAIDAMIPVGRGQRELIIGDRQTGKTQIALDTIINQAGEDMICIYVSIAQREGKLKQIYETLKRTGAMDYSIIVSAPASSSASLQYIAPYTGSAIAEYFLQQGKDVLIIYDDLSKHAVAYREISLLLRRPPGREAYPGDVFYIHSRLLERAVKLNEKNGGGSITALPIIETQAGDVSAYIPTNVISITDGQIFLESDLFNKGIKPAINVGISVSRVGGAAQTKIMKKISGTLKTDLAQYYELEAFSQFSSDLDESTKKTLKRGKIIVEALKQKQNSPYKLWQEVVLTWAATSGELEKYEISEISQRLSDLLSYFQTECKDLIKKIEKEKALSDDIKDGLKKHISHFYAN